MKRKIALLVLMILAMSILLVACNQTEETTIRARWEEETHVFNITLADFVSENSTSFNAYTADGVVAGNGTYYKDIASSNGFYNWDEIRPVAVSGTYIINIKPSDDGIAYCEVKTEQVMYVKYNLKSDLTNGIDFEKFSELRGAEATAEEYTAVGLTKEDGTTILKSTTVAEVRFENTKSQKPLESSTKVDGFYVGKVEQALTKYEIQTVYSYENKKPVATITLDGNTSEYTFAKNSAGNFIDSNQILMYLRSLNKTSSGFQDSPSKSVFNPYTQTLQTASFGLAYEYNVILTDSINSRNLATKLNVVSVTVGNNAFMMQENLPDTLADNLDSYSTLSGLEAKFTTVRFRVGYFAYEIDYTSTQNTSSWSEILTALSPAAEE